MADNWPKRSPDPAIILVAWRGSCSQLAAQYGMTLAELKGELKQLPRSLLGEKLLFSVDSQQAKNQFLAMIQRRRNGKLPGE
jgi:hypothetical protein